MIINWLIEKIKMKKESSCVLSVLGSRIELSSNLHQIFTAESANYDSESFAETFYESS